MNIDESGAYNFRPDVNEYDSHIYTMIEKVQITKCLTKDQFVVWFSPTRRTQGSAVVTITLEDLAVIKYEVELFGIPYDQTTQHEVTVNFHTPTLNHDEIFYTDSNGLEMQRRQLNYRPTWNLTTKDGGLNITANYYPV